MLADIRRFRRKGEDAMDMQIAIWVGAGVLLVLYLARRRKRKALR
jgi:hypothetical protein